MDELKLSKMFCENWYDNQGDWPTVEIVEKILKESVKVQYCKNLQELDGTPFRMLAIYWNPRLKILIRIDNINKTVVSLIDSKT